VPYIEYTFKIASAPKGARDAAGEPLGTVTFRHACDRPGHVRPDGIEVAPLRLGIPEYRVGDELVLFLTKESDLGFCAPVGLLQGVFRVARTGKTAEVRNELRNQRLFERVSEEAFEGLAPEEQPAALKGREAVTLDHFLKLCRSVKE
jgi:hypothetical protein